MLYSDFIRTRMNSLNTIAEVEGYPCILSRSAGKNLKDYKAYGNTAQTKLLGDYTELEYIESTGTQYIDTGFIANQDTSLEVECKMMDFSNYPAISNARNFPTSEYFGMSILSSSSYRFLNNSQLSDKITTQTILSDWCSYKLNKNLAYFNNTLVNTFTYTPVQINYPLQIFADNIAGVIGHKAKYKLRKYKIWDNEVLVRNMIPCKRNSDNVIGMYDIVNNVFYTNVGTGEFIAGAEIVPTPETPIPVYSLGERTRNLFNNAAVTQMDVTGTGAMRYGISFTDLNGTYTISSTPASINVYYKKIVDGVYEAPFDLFSSRTLTMNQGETLLVYAATMGVINSNLVQLEKGSIVTPYIPYNAIEVKSSNGVEEITTTIDLTGHEPLREIGDVADYTDYKNSRIVRKVAKLVLTGMETFYSSQTLNNIPVASIRKTSIETNSTVLPMESPKICCSHFNISTTYLTANVGQVYSGLTYINFNLDGANDLVTFKAWLAEQYANGTPVELYYPLAEPTYEAITLPQVQTTKGTCTITAQDEYLESSNIWAKYIK